jgi:tetratricopeptide (TPR) repeat protein
MYRPAIDALENARSLPDAGVLPDQALLILASRAGQPLEERWWRHLQANLRERAVGAQESSAIAALTTCHVSKACRFPPDEMMATYAAALSHGDDPMVLNSYANFALNELDDVDLALRLWRESKALNPREPQYRISLAKLFIATGHYDEARAEIAGIRTMGKLGQYRREAEALELRLGQSGGRP